MRETQTESNICACKECGRMKQRTFLKKMGKEKLYVDETGKRWNGHMCPSCHKVRARAVMAEDRKKKDVVMRLVEEELRKEAEVNASSAPKDVENA